MEVVVKDDGKEKEFQFMVPAHSIFYEDQGDFRAMFRLQHYLGQWFLLIFIWFLLDRPNNDQTKHI